MLTPNEKDDIMLFTKKNEKKKMDIKNKELSDLTTDSTGKYLEFSPYLNPEKKVLELLNSKGELIIDDEDDEFCTDGDAEDDEDAFTFPSFEGFFGQCTDFLYYSKHVKLSYSPFLAKCVKSLAIWEKFFTTLFLGGGTIPDALSLLDLDPQNRGYLYVRSPIHKIQKDDNNNNNDDNLSSYEYHYRDDGEHYITYPFFPYLFYLYAKEGEDSSSPSPPRTWSSNLFQSLCDHQGYDDDDDGPKELAKAAQDWTLKKIQRNSLDPKGSDDTDCGGEWFEAYLHAVHRDIYDDIDVSDCTQLLKKNKMKSLTGGKKYNIGKITVPSCKDGFDEILKSFDGNDDESHGSDEKKVVVTSINPRTEVMAKILIDIWMSHLVDFCTVLKIAEIVAASTTSSRKKKEKTKEKKKIVVVCYMGTAHTKAVAEFYKTCMGFKTKAFIGKTDYDDNESRCLTLPKSLWKFSDFFQ